MPLQLNGTIAIYANERLTNCYVVWEDKSSGKTMTAFMVDNKETEFLATAELASCSRRGEGKGLEWQKRLDEQRNTC
ncbi:unnamed protein product [Caretta caretta]